MSESHIRSEQRQRHELRVARQNVAASALKEMGWEAGRIARELASGYDDTSNESAGRWLARKLSLPLPLGHYLVVQLESRVGKIKVGNILRWDGTYLWLDGSHIIPNVPPPFNLRHPLTVRVEKEYLQTLDQHPDRRYVLAYIAETRNGIFAALEVADDSNGEKQQ